MVHALALIEAHIDFPEEEIGEAALAEMIRKSAAAAAILGDLLSHFSEGKVLRDGVAVLIAGKPNFGRSKLLNTLLALELLAWELREALQAVGEVTGEPTRTKCSISYSDSSASGNRLLRRTRNRNGFVPRETKQLHQPGSRGCGWDTVSLKNICGTCEDHNPSRPPLNLRGGETFFPPS